MNEDLQKALAEFVKSNLLTLQQGKDFILSQAPDFIQQLVRWHFWSAAITATSELIVIGVLIWLIISWLLPLARKNYEPIGEIIGIVGSCVGIVGLSIDLFVFEIPTMIQITVAPKVWLLEWALSQVKGN